MCPALMNYVTKAQNGFWTSVHDKTELHPQNRITIFLMVEHSNEVYKTTENIQIDGNLKYSSTKTVDVNLSKEYERGSCEILSQNASECIPTVSVGVMANCKDDLMFEETFDDETLLNTNRWSYDIRMDLYNDFFLYDNKKANLLIDNGILKITPTDAAQIRAGSIDLGGRCTAQVERKAACTRTAIITSRMYLPPVHSALINTKYSFSFKYGRVEVRARLPKGNWILPYIMLQESSKYSDDINANQIRIAFTRGNSELNSIKDGEIGGNHLYGGIYMNNNFKDLKDKISQKHWGDDFHKYELIWTPTKLSFAVDDETYGELDITIEEAHYIALGVSVGGHNDFPDDVAKPWTNSDPKAPLQFQDAKQNWKTTWSGKHSLEIDYLRVYAV